LTRVCCLAEFLTHAPCLTQIKDDIQHCDRTFKQKFGEVYAKMEDLYMKPTNQIWPQNDSERRAACW
jgi:hypothetical protein